MKNDISEERRAMRRANSSLDTITVLSRLKAELPEVWEIAEVVGRWVWCEFSMIPSEQVRTALLDLGFHWNHTRRAWQHACGHYAHHTKGNPRWKYMTAPATEFAETATT